MSEMTTIARPYAKAVFEHALAAKQLPNWSVILKNLTQAMFDPSAQRFVSNPTTTAALHTQLLLSIFKTSALVREMKEIEGLIVLLAENNRLLLLPYIYAQYEVLRAEQEKTLTVQVSSFSELTALQRQRLIESLEKRLQRQITLEVRLDKSLLGGAIIRAGDLVIDGSVRGKLNKLGADLVA